MPNVPVVFFLAYGYEQIEIFAITAVLGMHIYNTLECFDNKIFPVIFLSWFYSFVIYRWVVETFNNLRNDEKSRVQNSLRF